MKIAKKLSNLLSSHTRRILVFSTLFAGMGIVILMNVKATTSSGEFEVENGGKSGQIISCDNSTASNAKCIKFGSGAADPFNIPDTNSYTIPAGAKFVKPGGSGTRDCSSDANACISIAQGIAATPTNGTLILHGGVYYEGELDLPRPMTIQAYPGEKPWIDGTTTLSSGWNNPTGSYWVRNWNPTKLCRVNCMAGAAKAGVTYYIDGTRSDGTPPSSNVTVNYAARYPDQLFSGSTNLVQVATLGELAPGKFYISYNTDHTLDQIYVMDDPATAQFMASVQDYAINSYGSILNLRGVGIRRYGSCAANGGCYNAALMLTAGSTVQDTVVRDSAGSGINASGRGITITNTKVAYSGFTGLRAHVSGMLKIKGGRYAYSNQENFAMGWLSAAAAGLKITSTTGFTMTDAEIDHNKAAGLWCDLGCNNTVWVRNYVHDNEYTGMMYEVSQNGIIASNRVVRNNICLPGTSYRNCNRPFIAQAGIQPASSVNVQVVNNTLVDNVYDVMVTNDGRHVSGTTLCTSNVLLKNNLIVRSGLNSTANNQAPYFASYVLSGSAGDPCYATTSDVPSFFAPFGGITNTGFWRSTVNNPNNLYNLPGVTPVNDINPTPGGFLPLVSMANDDYSLTANGILLYAAGSPLSSSIVDAICLGLSPSCVAVGTPVQLGFLR